MKNRIDVGRLFEATNWDTILLDWNDFLQLSWPKKSNLWFPYSEGVSTSMSTKNTLKILLVLSCTLMYSLVYFCTPLKEENIEYKEYIRKYKEYKEYIREYKEYIRRRAIRLFKYFYQLKRTPDDFIYLISESNGYTGEWW